MEIKINIPQNDYVLSKQVRENVVQEVGWVTNAVKNHSWKTARE